MASLYEFLRNDAFDARNFFAATTEPLHQHQFGATLGGPIRRNKDFFFAYYEGQRDVQGKTQAAIVPTAAERAGDFSGLDRPRAPASQSRSSTSSLGQPFPGNRIPPFLINPIARNAANLYPLGNVSPGLFRVHSKS